MSWSVGPLEAITVKQTPLCLWLLSEVARFGTITHLEKLKLELKLSVEAGAAVEELMDA